MLQKQMKNASFKYPLQIKINTQRLHQTKGKSINVMNYCNFVLSVKLGVSTLEDATNTDFTVSSIKYSTVST